MSSDKPLSEDEYLKREAQLAQAALRQLRGEITQSLVRTADLSAWTERYPWPAVGTAAVSGVAAGWALGRRLRGGSKSNAESPEAAGGAKDREATENASSAETAAEPHVASRLVSGLGTFAGAITSAAVGAASEALVAVVKDTVRDSLHPQAASQATSNGDE
jgi:hypothetical protein